MRRADRLFEIVQYLRGRRLTTAKQLAEWLEISERTVYRDIADLLATGVPIDGEAGVGYRLHASFDLPPLMFTFDEVEALTAGARMVQSWSSPQLRRAAESALAKIAAALPKDKRAALESTPLFAPKGFIDAATGLHLDLLRNAIHTQQRVLLDYTDINGALSQRTVRPLACAFWGGTWTLAAWCERRDDFRTFRLDRIDTLQLQETRFNTEAGKTLADFLRTLPSEQPSSSE
jgi:predicted DNA-binding transcriptional regulator YafY